MFTLQFSVTEPNLDALKAELTRALPQVKSSHRCEAMARGIGFRSYAAARAAARDRNSAAAIVQGDLFNAYLAEHGFDDAAISLYRAAARVALANLREKISQLTAWGMGVGRPRRRADGKVETSAEMDERFAQERDDLTTDGTVDAFLVTLALLSRVPATKTIRSESGSYWLKHIAENYACSYPTGEKLGPRYVPNGAAIAAAVHAGFRFKPYFDEFGYIAINVSFNMSKPLLVDLDCEMRPTGGHAEDRRWRQRERAQRRQRSTPFRSLPVSMNDSLRSAPLSG